MDGINTKLEKQASFGQASFGIGDRIDPSAQSMSLNNKPDALEVDEFKKVLREIIELKQSKSGDYAGSWRALGMKGLLYQIARKFTRIWINKDKENLNNETFRDSLVDLAVYSIMCIQLIDDGDTSDKIDIILKNEYGK